MALLSSAILKIFTAVGSPSSVSKILFLSYIWQVIVNAFKFVLEFIMKYIWVIIKFVLGVLELFEYMINSFLGIGMGPADFLASAKNISISGGGLNFIDLLVHTFRAIVAVAIVILFIITIYAIIKQEARNAMNGLDGQSTNNSKKGIVLNLFKSMLLMIMIPLIMVFLLTGVSSILSSVNNALKGPTGSTIASQVLSTSTYNANRYRKYAETDRRVPIVIEAYDAKDYAVDDTEALISKIKSAPVQSSLLETALAISQNNFLTFKNSLSYKNNKLTNSSNYDSKFEKFVCTAEQYQVMADFVDYAEATGMDFYIKAMDEKDIDWKYVSSVIHNAQENSLTITYRDASDLNNNKSTSDTYEITYKMSYDVTSPISDALDSIMAMLGIGDYSTNVYNTMERDEDNDGVVNWSTEKVLIKLSEEFDLNRPSTWTAKDQIIIYEFFHFSENNTFQKYTLEDLKTTGVELDALQINYRDFYPEAGAYSSERTENVVLINSTYYNTVKSDKLRDEFGEFYYVLKDYDIDFLSSFMKIKNIGTTKLKLSRGFDINNPSSWSYSDQVLIYEFYKDLSPANELRSHLLSSYIGSGVEVPVYNIEFYQSFRDTNFNRTNNYVLINGTYYNVDSSYEIYDPENSNFITQASKNSYIVYNYETGYPSNSGGTSQAPLFDARDLIYEENSSENTDFSRHTINPNDEMPLTNDEISKYGNLAFTLSSTFDYRDTSTWTYRDLMLFYLYLNYPNLASSIDELKYTGLIGNICHVEFNRNVKIMLKLEIRGYSNAQGNSNIYIDVDAFKNLEEIRIMKFVDDEQTRNSNNYTMGSNSLDESLFIGSGDRQFFDDNQFLNAETEYYRFVFSDNFNASTPTGWTMGDVVLLALSLNGYLPALGERGTGGLLDYGYNSLCYKSDLDGNKYFQFGMNQKIYLSMNYISSFKSSSGTQMFDSIEQWANCNVMEFIAKKYGINTSDIVTSEENILNVIYNLGNFEAKSVRTFVEEAVEKYGMKMTDDSTIKVFDRVDKYSYKNNNFSQNDLRTWTNLDFAIYYLTGKCNGEFSSIVVENGGKQYFLVNNVGLDISAGSPFESALSSSYKLFSATNDVADVTASQSYFETNLSRLILSDDDAAAVKPYNNAKFEYEKSNENTDLDVIYYNLFGDALAAGSKISVGLYYLNDFYYIKLTKNGKSFFVSTDSRENSYGISIQFEMKDTLSHTKSACTSESSYSAFEHISDSNPQITKLDAIIYSKTKRVEQRDYDIYSLSLGAKTQKFISLSAGSIIQISDDLLVSTQMSSVSANEELARRVVQKFNLSTISYDRQESTKFNYIEFMDFDVNDISTWTPFDLVLFDNGIISGTANGSSGLTFDVVYDRNGKQYLKYEFGFHDVIYISVENFGLECTSAYVIKNTENAKAMAFANALLCYDNFELSIPRMPTFNSILEDVLSISSSADTEFCKLENSYKRDFGEGTNLLNMEVDDWSWLEIVYFYYYNLARTETKFNVVHTSSGEFVELGERQYLLYDEFLVEKFGDIMAAQGDTFVANYDFELGEYSEIDLFAYRNTGMAQGEISYFYLPLSHAGSEYKFVKSDGGKNAKFFFTLGSGETNVAYIAQDLSEQKTVQKDYESVNYTINSINDLLNWSVFDFIVGYITGSVDQIEHTFEICEFNGLKFIKNGSTFVNISFLKNNDQEKLLPQLEKSNENSGDDALFVQFGPNAQFSPSGEVQDNEEILRVSGDFKTNDPTTWTVSDFVLYHYWRRGYFGDISFQNIVENGVKATIKYLIVSSTERGDILIKVLSFNDLNSDLNLRNEVLNYNIFHARYGIMLKNIVYSSSSDVSLGEPKISTVNPDSETGTDPNIGRNNAQISEDENGRIIYNLSLYIRADLVSNNFLYNNFYFFTYDFDEFEKSSLKVPLNVVKKVQDGDNDVVSVGTINLRISQDFDINDINTWTVLDFIIIYEASRAVQNNAFSGLSLAQLKEITNRIPIFEVGGSASSKIIYINGQCYNLFGNLENEVGNVDFVVKTKLVDLKYTNEEGREIPLKLLSKGSVDDYSFRFLAENINFNVDNLQKFVSDDLLPTQFEYEKSNEVYRYDINTNTIDAFRVNVDDTSKYPPETLKISTIVKEVNWPQKLINDMKIIYPNLNWETLLATHGWVDTLGDFSSAIASGNYVTEGNSANITAAGLVLSEFFLAIAKESDKNYANFEYEPVFDEHTIKALMLSMLGEDNYKAVSEQAKVFNELFNTAFAKILDDIARENGEAILDGKVNNFAMSVYKAYISTVILSSDFGEYLYTVATRVYAQYTIFESLAYASGDYARYYAFVNNLLDENGSEVDSFAYSSFYELVKYENASLPNVPPTFTFCFKKVYEQYIKENDSLGSVREALLNEQSFNKVYTWLDTQYRNTYRTANKIGDSDYRYCFLLDVYWTVRDQLESQGKKNPAYMDVYKQYLDGKITRWSILKATNSDVATGDIKNYTLYQALLIGEETKLSAAIFNLLPPDIDRSDMKLSFSSDWLDNFTKKFQNIFSEQEYESKVSIPYGLIRMSLSDEYKALFDDMFSVPNWIAFVADIVKSHQGSELSWNNLNEKYETLTKLCNAFGVVDTLPKNSSNEYGTKLGYVSDELYSEAYNSLQDIKANFEKLIALQNKLDQIVKVSITFMLAQYGQNYVSDGYTFHLENRKYSLQTSVTSSARIAEYVYGGAYLENFGVEPRFTSSDFNGIIKATSIYDSSTNSMKKHLIVFDEMRQFVTSLADYTANLYYLTNLNDLSDNVGDEVLLTNYVWWRDEDQNIDLRVTPEFLILKYLIENEDVSVDTWIRLIFGDTLYTINNMNVPDKYSGAINIAKMLNNQLGREMGEEEKKASLVNYLKLILDDTIYNAYGYYNSGADKGYARLHKAFKNVITYLILNEDSENSAFENTVNLDNISIKDLRILFMKKIVDYQKNESESAAENANRYIALFNLISGELNFRRDVSDGVYVGRTISYENIAYDGNEPNQVMFSDEVGDAHVLYATYKISAVTKNNIIRLAGIANRPIEDLVNLEYDHLYDMEGNYDEANGDTFILCTYDELSAKFVPVLARGVDTLLGEDSAYNKYREAYGINFSTSYYNTGIDTAYPIVAKGAITNSMMPTAIRMVGGNVRFYRTDISASAQINEDAATVTQYVQETNTIGYTNYVDRATSKKLSGSSRQTMFLSQVSLATYLSSDFSGYFIQITNSYDVTTDGVNRFNVLDNIQSFFGMSYIDYFMLILGFSVMFPFLFRASLMVIQRIFDLIFLTLMGPLAISLNGLNIDDGSGASKRKTDNRAFETWQNYLTHSLLQAFGVVVGFNLYYILMSTLIRMDFVSEFTYNKLANISGFPIFSLNTLNTFVKYLFIITAAGIIKVAGDLIVSIMTTGKVTSTFESSVSGDALNNVQESLKQVKKSFTDLRDMVTGKALIEAKDAAIQYIKTSLPGAEIIAEGKKIFNFFGDKVKQAAMKKALQAYGVPPDVAKKLSKQMIQAQKQQRIEKEKKRVESANKFQERMGLEKFEDKTQKQEQKRLEKEKGKDKKSKDKKGGGKKPKKAKKSRADLTENENENSEQSQ